MVPRAVYNLLLVELQEAKDNPKRDSCYHQLQEEGDDNIIVLLYAGRKGEGRHKEI